MLAACVLGGCLRAGGPRFNGAAALELATWQVEVGPRTPGSVAHDATRAWIVRTLEDNGWLVEQQPVLYNGTRLYNVIGRLGESREGPILLGAHYDTRPRADRDATHPDLPVPGANDGASGVAVLLELARVLPARLSGQEVWLVFFDGEDSGNLDGWEWAAGAEGFVAELVESPQAVLVVDMVGDADLRIPMERNSTPDLVRGIWQVAEKQGAAAFVSEPGGSILDDHRPFVERGIPAVDIIDIEYPFWHTTADTLDKISAESLAQVGRVLEEWILSRR